MKVESATPEDGPALGALQQRCFTGPFFERIWPTDPNGPGVSYLREEWTRIIGNRSGEHPARAAVVKTDGAITSGVLVWIVQDGVAHYNDRWAPLRPGMEDEAWEQFMGPMYKQQLATMGDQDHVYVEIAMTDAEYRNQGQASALLQWASDLADELGVAAFLNAGKSRVNLYAKFGFVQQNLGWESGTVPMKREANR